jgi:hypothetical protein
MPLFKVLSANSIPSANTGGLLVALALLALTGCGRMTAPVAPERLSPSAVQSLAAAVDSSAVVLQWSAPDSDQRGEPLRSIDAYEVLRKELEPGALLVDVSDDDFAPVGTVPDRYLAALRAEELRLKGEGIPTRRARVSPDLRAYTFRDTSVEPGKDYVYRIVATNQGGERGAFNQQVRVVFRGEGSDLRIAAPGKGQFDEFEGSFEASDAN